ncbi:MAG: cupin domain-containing protein [Gaiellaceae bacterium]
MGESFTIKRQDQLEHPYAKWWLVRKSLGIASFGANLVELQPGERIPEHDERERDQEELFLTLSGAPTLVIDDLPHELPEGSFARVDVPPRRYLRNEGDSVALVLIVSAPRTSGYEPPDWA